MAKYHFGGTIFFFFFIAEGLFVFQLRNNSFHVFATTAALVIRVLITRVICNWTVQYAYKVVKMFISFGRGHYLSGRNRFLFLI